MENNLYIAAVEEEAIVINNTHTFEPTGLIACGA